jgi:hypothetical protein
MQVLEIFRRDIDRVLALGGWDAIAQLDRGVLAPAGAWDAGLAPASEPEPAAPRVPRTVRAS